MAPRVVFWLGIATAVMVVAQRTDHYATLGIKRTATLAEVKRAYRAKALTSHPDKAKPGEEEAATEAFRQVALAYETLSDPQERRIYDAGGMPGGAGRAHGGGGGAWFWSAHFHGFSGGQQQQWGNMREHFLRPEVRRAQERPIKLRSLEHLRSSALGDDGLTERALLLALSDGGEQCADVLKFETQFPAPFAGWSEATLGSGLWWCAQQPPRRPRAAARIPRAASPRVRPPPFAAREDLLQTYTGSAADDPSLGRLFQAPAGGDCPTIVFVPKGARLESFVALRGAPARSWRAFSAWVWERLRTVFTIKNLHHSPVQIWWASGNSARKISLLQPGASHEQASYISHRFLAWDARTEGNTLADDTLLGSMTLGSWGREEFVVRTRCVDLDGSCGLWRQRGECGRNEAFMGQRCQRACGRCPPEPACRDSEEVCAVWAAEGHCEGNAAWMIPNCRKSCDACSADAARGKDEM